MSATRLPPSLSQWQWSIALQGLRLEARSGRLDRTPKLQTGMTLAIIVIAHAQEPQLRVDDNQWGVSDTRLTDSAYFSAMVRVTDEGYELLNQYPRWIEPVVSRTAG